MRPIVYNPTRLHSGAGLLRGRAPNGGAVAIVVDPGIAQGRWGYGIRQELARFRPEGEWISADGEGIAAITTLAGRISDAAVVLGVGGGSTMDLVKLASAVFDRNTAARLATAQRSGLLLLPCRARSKRQLWLMPTTLGTGAELSPAACMSTADGKKLVLGDSLRADCAFLDPVATETLPVELIVEGVLEALFRVIAPYVGDPVERPVPDALAEALAARLVQLGDEAVRGADAGVRLSIAEASGCSHAGWLHFGRDPFSAKGWFLATELSCAVGARKNAAIAVLLPALWRAIQAGERRWGSHARLNRIWRLVRGDRSADPARGTQELLDSWQIPRLLPRAVDLNAVAHRVVRAWGGGLPMLGSLSTRDVRDVLADALSGAA